MSGWHIVWHDRDLRIEDNPALSAAAQSGRVLPLYIHSPIEEGNWQRGAASNWWLNHSLLALQEQYQAIGSFLTIRKGEAIKVLEKLFSEIPVEAIYWNERYEPELRERDQQLLSWLEERGVSVHCFEGNYLINPSKLFNKSGNPYTVFTPFSKRVVELRCWREPLPLPMVSGDPSIQSDTVESLQLLPFLSWADGFSDYWSPGSRGAKSALESFKEHVDRYGEERDIPSLPATSKLSSHLHFGEISPHTIWRELEQLSDHSFPYLRQLLWREFGNYFLFHSPTATDQSWKENFESFPWEQNSEALQAWQKGETGYPIVDAGMRELWQTGWMHNRVRMIVASFLVKDLFVHWVEGARWFWDTLVDADLANNTMGWQWVAGSGPDAAPYFRIFNPILQGKKFDPEGFYIRRWVPELADLPKKLIHTPWEASERVFNYPAPIVDHSEVRKKALEAYQRIK